MKEIKKIKVLQNDLLNEDQFPETKALELAISRSLNIPIVVLVLSYGRKDQVLSIWREDNQANGWCLGYLPNKCYEFYKNKKPFTFILEHHDVEQCRPKDLQP